MNFIIEWFLPPKVKVWVRALLSRFTGFKKVKSWESAVRKSSGYESVNVVEPIVAAARQLQSNSQTTFVSNPRYQQIAAGMLFSISQERFSNGEPIRMLDVGGAGADYFYQFQEFAPHINFDWTVLETPALAEAMSNEFGRNLSNLRWLDSIENTDEIYDVVLCSGVLQCVEKPFEIQIEMKRLSGSILTLPLGIVLGHTKTAIQTECRIILKP